MRRRRKTKTLLVDGNVLMKRAFNGAKNLYFKEEHIGGIYQFYTTLRKLINELKVSQVIVSWDGENGGTLRLDYYPTYKNNRPSYFDKEFELQKRRVQQYAEELFIKQYQHSECESDDVIAYYCQNRKSNEDVVIYTTDRDMCQLIGDGVSIYLADKKVEVNENSYYLFFQHYYENAGLVKIIEGCQSDNIKGIEGVSEKTLLTHFPEIKERKVSLEEIINKAKQIQQDRGSPLKALDNIINGVSKGSHKGDFYEINDKIINLQNPLLTEEAEEELTDFIELPLDPEGRSIKNVFKMMIEDGFMYCIPGGENGYQTYMEPFIKLMKKEKKKFKSKK